jgi:hypothetical protein
MSNLNTSVKESKPDELAKKSNASAQNIRLLKHYLIEHDPESATYLKHLNLSSLTNKDGKKISNNVNIKNYVNRLKSNGTQKQNKNKNENLIKLAKIILKKINFIRPKSELNNLLKKIKGTNKKNSHVRSLIRRFEQLSVVNTSKRNPLETAL